jgi:hypothetical protein
LISPEVPKKFEALDSPIAVKTIAMTPIMMAELLFLLMLEWL